MNEAFENALVKAREHDSERSVHNRKIVPRWG